jgi:acyl-CoA reductase-like NAD-dependent aldehyde dehydrogenase
MKTKYFRSILGALVIAAGALSATAQTTPPPLPPDISKLGPELKALIAAHRDTAKALLEARRAALEALKNATPAEIDALKAALRDIMQQRQQEQRELAKAIRDAIKARRDQLHKPAGS